MITLETYQNKYDQEIYYLTLNTYPDIALAIYMGHKYFQGAVCVVARETLEGVPTRASILHPINSVDVLNILEELNKDTNKGIINDFKKEFMKAYTV